MDFVNFVKEVFEDTLGLDVLGMENQYKSLLELINRKTLPVFSQYIPCHYYTYVKLDHYKKQMIYEDHNRVGREYYLDDPALDKFNIFIMGVDKVDVSTGSMFDPDKDSWYSQVLTSRQNISLDSILLGAESTYGRNIADFAIPFKKHFEYRGNRVLYLRNYPFNGEVEVTLSTNWPNVASIPQEFQHDLVRLAQFDVKIKAWNELKYMENIPLPTGGNLDLKISDWESAANDREDFLRDLRSKTLPDRAAPFNGGAYHIV